MPAATVQMDYEVELKNVMGREAKNVCEGGSFVVRLR